jgi:hypothetical protein
MTIYYVDIAHAPWLPAETVATRELGRRPCETGQRALVGVVLVVGVAPGVALTPRLYSTGY